MRNLPGTHSSDGGPGCIRPDGVTTESLIRKLWLIAAALLAGILAPVLYFELRGPGSPSELATSAAYPAAFPLVTRDRPRTTEDELRRQAQQAYTEADYQTAERLFSELTADPETRFYLGVCQYFLDRYEDCVANLTAAMKHPKWYAPGLWYRASARLRLGQAQAARKDLLELVQRRDEYGAKAAELLDKLDQVQ